MKKFYYDLHMHSCLSPCGDDDMTPNNIAGMGVVAKARYHGAHRPQFLPQLPRFL